MLTRATNRTCRGGVAAREPLPHPFPIVGHAPARAAKNFCKIKRRYMFAVLMADALMKDDRGLPAGVWVGVVPWRFTLPRCVAVAVEFWGG